jgi:hypothetical protein
VHLLQAFAVFAQIKFVIPMPEHERLVTEACTVVAILGWILQCIRYQTYISLAILKSQMLPEDTYHHWVRNGNGAASLLVLTSNLWLSIVLASTGSWVAAIGFVIFMFYSSLVAHDMFLIDEFDERCGEPVATQTQSLMPTM